jgi:hypothetical protein
MEYSISYSEIIIGILTLTATSFGFIIKEQRDKIRTVRNQLSEKKYGVYNDVFSVFFNLIRGQKGFTENNEQELADKIISIKKDLLIYAPDNILKKFLEWNRFIANNEGDLKHAKIYLELFVLIRKDMGNHKTEINEADILKLIMTTDSEFEKMWELIK